MIRKLSLAGLALMLFSAAGCNSISDMCIEQEMACRNHVLAIKGWGAWSWYYDKLDYPHDFASGFRAGYENILAGGKGCQPTLPPRLYWKPCYQNPQGQCKIQSWFDGYSHGALAAQQEGYGNMQTIPLSSTARQNFLNSKIPASNACFAEPGAPIAPGQHELLEMPGPVQHKDVLHDVLHDGPLIDSQDSATIELAPRPYEEK